MHFPHSFTIQDVEIAICPLFPSKLRFYYTNKNQRSHAVRKQGLRDDSIKYSRSRSYIMLAIMYDGETFKELRWSDLSAAILPCLRLTGVMVNSH